MITLAQAQEYIAATLGASVPGFIVQAALDQVAAAEPSMIAAGYTASQVTLVQSMATAIVACAGNPARIQSQGAPSGASRSFKHFDDALSALRKSLQHLDSANTTTNIVGPDPQADAWAMVC
jgi:hypothetical protein